MITRNLKSAVTASPHDFSQSQRMRMAQRVPHFQQFFWTLKKPHFFCRENLSPRGRHYRECQQK